MNPNKKTNKETVLEANPEIQGIMASENRPSMPAMNPTRQSPKDAAQQNAELYAKAQTSAGTPTTEPSTGDAYADYINGQTSFDSDGNLAIDKQSMGAPTETAPIRTETTPTATRSAETNPTTTTETVGTKSAEGETGNPNVLDYDTWKTTDYYAAQQERAKAAAQEQHDIATAYANAQYGQAMEASAQAHEKALNDAMNAYALRRSTYGSQGEFLGRNGLAMSGYSDYADQVAYATSRGEIAQAGANRTLAEQNALNAYQEYLANADIAKSQADANADISFYQQMGAYQQGQDELQAKYEAALQEKQGQNFQTFYDNYVADPSAYSREQIQALVDVGVFSQEQGNALFSVKDSYDQNMENYLKSFDQILNSLQYNSNPDEAINQIGSTIDGEYAEGNITKEVYQEAYSRLVSRKIENVDESNVANIKDVLSSFREEGKLSNAGYAKAIELLNKTTTDQLGTHQLSKEGYSRVIQKGRDSHVGFGRTWSIGDQMADFLNEYAGTEDGTVAQFKGKTYIHVYGSWREAKGQIVDYINEVDDVFHKA